MPASVQDEARARRRASAPAATVRAAAMPCVSGRQRETALIHPGQLVERDVHAAEEEHQEVREVRGEEEVLRTQADRAEQHPERGARGDRDEHDDDERRDRVERPGGSRGAATPAPKVNAETNRPFASTGTPRPRNTAARFAGDASRGPSVPNQRSFATAIVMPYTDDIAHT